ncbi:hypothetical protein U369_18805 [Bacillus anthracis 52-G]|nr:hypothetical protein FORC48_3695 [Bacillus cereus]EVT92082.1 hypothetical protein U368_18620 [Bacillus anthracis 8903-G]EVT97417.1 hypothetical protein U365_16550 [Bacillus anthracis 9080-G]EVU03466.1 hypothetical protein U369_18805 [Bacillus anthracis 52-G]EXJ19439.1 hypothetical protein Y693_18510 [Bacillus anthracis str. 95014]
MSFKKEMAIILVSWLLIGVTIFLLKYKLGVNL